MFCSRPSSSKTKSPLPRSLTIRPSLSRTETRTLTTFTSTEMDPWSARSKRLVKAKDNVESRNCLLEVLLEDFIGRLRGCFAGNRPTWHSITPAASILDAALRGELLIQPAALTYDSPRFAGDSNSFSHLGTAEAGL